MVQEPIRMPSFSKTDTCYIFENAVIKSLSEILQRQMNGIKTWVIVYLCNLNCKIHYNSLVSQITFNKKIVLNKRDQDNGKNNILMLICH